jgi:hypothetical protein
MHNGRSPSIQVMHPKTSFKKTMFSIHCNYSSTVYIVFSGHVFDLLQYRQGLPSYAGIRLIPCQWLQ